MTTGPVLDTRGSYKLAVVIVEPGRGIALMPDDIHAIVNSSANTARHLHFYGHALETLTTRLQFNLEKQPAVIMAPVVTTRI